VSIGHLLLCNILDHKQRKQAQYWGSTLQYLSQSTCYVFVMATSCVRSEVDIFALVLMDKGKAQFN
jgi:hypothetical protein